MSDNDVRSTVTHFFDEKPILKGIDPDLDFFSIGASSLTVIDLQIQIEEALKLSVSTSTLMGNPTVNAWVNAYERARSETMEVQTA